MRWDRPCNMDAEVMRRDEVHEQVSAGERSAARRRDTVTVRPLMRYVRPRTQDRRRRVLAVSYVSIMTGSAAGHHPPSDRPPSAAPRPITRSIPHHDPAVTARLVTDSIVTASTIFSDPVSRRAIRGPRSPDGELRLLPGSSRLLQIDELTAAFGNQQQNHPHALKHGGIAQRPGPG